MFYLYRILFNNIQTEGLLFGAFGIVADENGNVSPAGKLVMLSLIGILWVALSYLIGSVNFSIIISKKKFGDDVRNYGSGNAGTSNMQRTYGNKVAAITLLGDVTKGVFAVLTARFLFGTNIAFLAGTACIIGHCFPCYFGFKGGKGVATSIAVILCLSPVVGLMLLAIFALLVAFTRYISLGSITAALFFPFLLDRYYRVISSGWEYPLHPTFTMTVCSILIAVIVVFRHKQNIKNLFERKERKLSFGKKKDPRAEAAKEAPISYHNIDKDDE